MFYRYEHYMSISHIALIANMVHMLEIVVRNNNKNKKKKKLSSLNKIMKILKIFIRMRVNGLFGFSIVSSNYVFTNHTHNMYKQALALNNL